MADDKGNIYDSITDIDEEEFLEKAKGQESLGGPEAREEHFKQNIMMDVADRPDGVEIVDQSENQQDIEEVTEPTNQTVQQNAGDPSVDVGSNRPEYEDKESDQQTLANQANASVRDGVERDGVINQDDAKDSSLPDYGNQGADKFSAFEQQSVDQQIEEVLIGPPDNPETNMLGVSDISDIDTSANQINEAASIGDFVGVTAFTSDENIDDEVTYSLSVNPNNAFAIDVNTGEVTVNDPSQLDFENSSSMQIEVTATSEDGSTSSETFNIAINDADEFDVSAVTDSDNATNEISESASVGASVGVTAFASDADGSNNDVTYSLSSNPGNAFSIDADTGEVTVNDPSALDFENASSMQIEVTATSEDGSTSSETFNIAINDADEFDISAVTDSDNATNAVSESAVAGASVGVTAFASDADGSNNDVTYSLSSNPGNAFSIDAATGEVTVNDPSQLNFENSASMQIEVTATSEDGSTSSELFTINITNANEDPVITKVEVSDTLSSFNQFDLVLDQSGTTGTFGDNVNVSALQPGGDASQLIISGDGIGIQSTNVTNDISNQIDFDPTTGASEQLILEFLNPVENLQLTTGKQFAGEGGIGEQGIWTAYDAAGNVIGSGELDTDLGVNLGGNSYQYEINADAPIASIVIEANDYSDSDFSIVNIQYNETIEIPLIDGEEIALDISESVSNGSVIADVSAFDVDGDELTFSIDAENDDGAFVIDSATGVITVADTSAIDVETLSDRTLTITVNDGNGGTDSVDFILNIQDENEFSISAVSDVDNATNQVSESAVVGASVGISVFASDADSTNSDVTYSLSSNPGNAFTIDEITGEVTVSDPGALDFEKASSMQIEVTATSQDGSTSSETFDIGVKDISEAPTDLIVNGASLLTENDAAAGSIVATVSAVDSDVGDMHSYVLTDDAGGKFQINSTTGEISLVAVHDASSVYSGSVMIEATDSAGNTYAEVVDIHLGTDGVDSISGGDSSEY